MGEHQGPVVGSVVWRDLTVEDADGVRRFYEDVVGWTTNPHDMGEYHDFDVKTAAGETVAGICHARGTNAAIPPQWLVYVRVEDVDASAERCVARGGEVVDGPRAMGKSRFCVVRDPAGAVLGLIS
jgi:predicted enzyme related to lactoylglutathione lyase